MNYKETISSNQPGYIVLDLNSNEKHFEFTQSISAALSDAEIELQKIAETIDSIRTLTPECDKLDYALAVSSGALCGIFDIFLVGKPNETQIGDVTDKWFENITKDFAKLCGWDDSGEGSLSSAIRYLENKFRVPYDQSIIIDPDKKLNITPTNHHLNSIDHNPSLIGLFFSIYDQFTNKSHFINSEAKLIAGGFELQGHDFLSKLFFAFRNWFGHLISDISGSSTSNGRGMGIPSPLWTWINDIIAIKSKLNISSNKFDRAMHELALKIYSESYDARFQTAQLIPVILNEMIVRFFYSVRRLIKFFSVTNKESQSSFSYIWKACEPFSNVSVKRMLTVAHGTFCLLDISDATIRSLVTGAGTFIVKDFVMRLNIIGVGSFVISLYGEAKRKIKRSESKENLDFLKKEEKIVVSYIEGLQLLSELYNDQYLLTFTEDLNHCDLYIQAFEKSVQLAEKRKVPNEIILRTKADIDNYFQRRTNNV